MTSAPVYTDLLELIGNSPLLELTRVGNTEAVRGQIWAKLEYLCPGGSIKDRVALALLDQAEAQGLLAPGGVVIEPTSGNMGIGLAVVCKKRAYRLILTMPESMSLERRQLLKAFGAELVLTPEAEQMAGAVAKANELAAALPGAFQPRQFENAANPQVHADSTAQELLLALDGQKIDAFVCSVGTGGTISGVGRRLKEQFPNCRVVAVEPESCPTLSRGLVGPSKIQGLAAGFVPKNFDASVVDEIRTVSDELAYKTKQDLARREGVLVGLSSGANVAIALELAEELGPGSQVVTVLCDTGERYFSLDGYFEPGEATG